jgi:hypothetical protein
MSVGIASQNHYAYMDQHVEGGATVQYYRSTSSQVAAANTEGTTASAAADEDTNLFGKDGFGFDDFLDIINPLQHIPIISTLYREITGDQLEPGARIIGGGLFGGGIGLAASVVNTMVEAETGKDIGEHVVAMVSGDEAADDTILAKSAAPAEITAPQAVITSPTPAAAAQIIPASFNSPQSTLSQAQTPTASTSPKSSDRLSDEKAASIAPASAPPLAMGLEWKTQPPNLHKNIDKIRASQGDNLTPDQLSRILGAFSQAPQKPGVEALKKEKPANEQVSEITPTDRMTANQSYQQGVSIAATPPNLTSADFAGPLR